MHHEINQINRRITGDLSGPWTISTGLPIQTITPMPPKTKLADKYREIASSTNLALIVSAKLRFDNKMEEAAKAGKRTTNLYLTTDELRVKEQISTWLRDEGFNFEWKSEQREGTWVVVSW